MINFNENQETLFTPKQIAQEGLMSLVYQWKKREDGTLKFFKLGRKIYYSGKHITDYLASCERNVGIKYN